MKKPVWTKENFDTARRPLSTLYKSLFHQITVAVALITANIGPNMQQRKQTKKDKKKLGLIGDLDHGLPVYRPPLWTTRWSWRDASLGSVSS